MTIVIDVIEAFLQLAPTLLLGCAATVFDADLDDSWMRWPANQNSYHQIFPRLIRDIAGYSLISPHSGGAAVNQRDSSLQSVGKRATPPVLPGGIALVHPPL